MNPSSLRGLPFALRVSVTFYLLHAVFQGKSALVELGAFWTIFFLLWAVARGECRLSFHILYFPLLLYCIASTVSALANSAGQHAYADAMTWFKVLIFPAALILFRLIPDARELALRAHILFGVGVASYGLYQYARLEQRDLEHRITGVSTHVLTYSGLLLPLSLLLLVVAVHRRQVWLWAATLVVSTALLLTFTRSVWLGWIVAVLTLFALTRPRWLVYAVPLLLIFISFMPLALFSRFASSFDVRQASNLDRIRMAEGGIEMIKDRPTLGVGPANVKEVYPLYRKADAPRFRPPHLHNNVIQLWAERGVVGLAAYVLLLALFLRECARAWRTPARMWAEAGVAVTVGLTYAGLFEFNFGDTEVFYLMMDLFALMVASMEAAQPGMNEVGEPAVPVLLTNGQASTPVLHAPVTFSS
jgi:O-antigen ligase